MLRQTTFLALLAITTPVASQDAPRSAAAILNDFDSVPMPRFSDGGRPDAVARFREQIADGVRRKGALAMELWRAHPEHERVPGTLSIRWAGFMNTLEQHEGVYAEAEEFLDEDLRVELRREAAVARAGAALGMDELTVAQKLADLRTAIELAPEDVRTGVYLLKFIKQNLVDPDEMRRLTTAALEGWPDSRWVTAPAQALLRQLDRVGEVLELRFVDVRSGDAIDLADLDSEYVVLHVWAGKVENSGVDALRALRGRHDPDVLRIVSIYNFRHRGGRQGLRKLLEEQEIPWPHRHLERSSQSPGVERFGVPEMPFYFLLGPERRVRAVGCRPELLEEMLLELREDTGETQ